MDRCDAMSECSYGGIAHRCVRRPGHSCLLIANNRNLPLRIEARDLLLEQEVARFGKACESNGLGRANGSRQIARHATAE
jgi:hypothetical protein